MENQVSTDWRALRAEIEAEIDAIWLDMPLDVEKVQWNIIQSGAGSGGQSFTVLVHLEAFLMIFGANILFRFLKIAKEGDLTLAQLRSMTEAFIIRPFNVFEFIGDLGLPHTHQIGERYVAALAALDTKDDYIELTGTLFTYVVKMHRWIHFIFPWNLGVAFPHRKPDEILAFASRLSEVKP